MNETRLILDQVEDREQAKKLKDLIDHITTLVQDHTKYFRALHEIADYDENCDCDSCPSCMAHEALKP